MIASIGKKLRDLFIKDRNRALSIVLVLATIIICRQIYKIQAKHVESLNVKREVELKKNEVLGEISQSEKEIENYKGLLKRKDASLVINLVSKIAKDYNVKVISIKPNAQENYSGYVKYPFALTLSADSYHKVGKFINKIESDPDIYFFDALNIKLQEKEQFLNEAQEGLPKTGNELIVDLILNVIAFAS